MLRPSPEDYADPPHSPTQACRRIAVELYCLGLVFRFHHRNNHLRKATTMSLVFVWVAITLGLSFGFVDAVATPYYGVLTALVFAIVGRMWDIEVQTFAAGALQSMQDEQSGEDGDE